MISPRGPEAIGEPALPAPAVESADLSIRTEQIVEDGGRLAPLSVEGHEWTLFTESTPMLAALMADLRAAQRRIWIETYIFANDQAGQSLADLLAQRARDGLDVRLMYDTVGSLLTPSALFQPLREAGVRVWGLRGSCPDAPSGGRVFFSSSISGIIASCASSTTRSAISAG